MLDSFDRNIHYLRISVTDRCNMRCTYCMPKEGIKLVKHSDILRNEEIVTLVETAVKLGFNKFRLTGGEPLLRRGIVDLVASISRINGVADLAMTTNGLLLDKFALPLKKAGLHRLNISLDTLDPEIFRSITRTGNLEEVLAGIFKAKAVGFGPIKLNCVILKDSDEREAGPVGNFAAEHGLEIRYIYRMNIAKGEFWGVRGGIGGQCCLCNRIRVSSEGKIYPCLFYDRFFDLRQLGIERALCLAIGGKPENGTSSLENQFYHIGG